MIRSRNIKDCMQTKWCDKNGWCIEESDWKKICTLPFQVTVEAKLRSFQFQCVRRSLVTNKYLKMCNIKNNDKCYYCKTEVETIEHLLYDCDIVKQLWQGLATTLGSTLEFHRCINKKDVILGVLTHVNSVESKMLNHLIIMVKRYIYVTKCLERYLNISELLRFIKNHYDIEKDIAFRNNTVDICNKKWNHSFNIIDL